ERSGELDRSLPFYLRSGHANARLRAVRIMERCGRLEAAIDLAGTAYDLPANEAEAEQARRTLRRLIRKSGRNAMSVVHRTQIDEIASELQRPALPTSVEQLARACLDRNEAPVYYVENTLINGLFGLLCWDAIFAPLPGAFFNPFQRAPADLHSTNFRERR